MNVSFENVEFGYQNNFSRMLPGYHTIAPGQALAILGRNGVGKSTLLRTLAGQQKLLSGKLELDQKSSRLLIPADPIALLLPWYSIAANLALLSSGGKSKNLSPGLMDEFCSSLSKILSRNISPDFLKQPILKTSSGERAVIALCAAFAVKPTVLLIDEVFANLSQAACAKIIESLKIYLKSGSILIFTTHQIELIDRLTDLKIEINGV
jgi:ABC-type Mn2+/Zn2+ transport system ATPase subunit